MEIIIYVRATRQSKVMANSSLFVDFDPGLINNFKRGYNAFDAPYAKQVTIPTARRTQTGCYYLSINVLFWYHNDALWLIHITRLVRKNLYLRFLNLDFVPQFCLIISFLSTKDLFFSSLMRILQFL